MRWEEGRERPERRNAWEVTCPKELLVDRCVLYRTSES